MACSVLATFNELTRVHSPELTSYNSALPRTSSFSPNPPVTKIPALVSSSTYRQAWSLLGISIPDISDHSPVSFVSLSTVEIEASELLSWPPVMMMLDPVDTAQDLARTNGSSGPSNQVFSSEISRISTDCSPTPPMRYSLDPTMAMAASSLGL